MRAVLDTVVILRALINPRSRAGRLVFELSDSYAVVLSPEIIREILDVISRSSLRRRFPQLEDAHLDRVLATLASPDVVEPKEVPRVCRDPGDDKFFAAAVAGHADCIVSEDNDILSIASYDGIRTVNIRDFLAELQAIERSTE